MILLLHLLPPSSLRLRVLLFDVFLADNRILSLNHVLTLLPFGRIHSNHTASVDGKPRRSLHPTRIRGTGTGIPATIERRLQEPPPRSQDLWLEQQHKRLYTHKRNHIQDSYRHRLRQNQLLDLRQTNVRIALLEYTQHPRDDFRRARKRRHGVSIHLEDENDTHECDDEDGESDDGKGSPLQQQNLLESSHCRPRLSFAGCRFDRVCRVAARGGLSSMHGCCEVYFCAVDKSRDL